MCNKIYWYIHFNLEKYLNQRIYSDLFLKYQQVAANIPEIPITPIARYVFTSSPIITQYKYANIMSANAATGIQSGTNGCLCVSVIVSIGISFFNGSFCTSGTLEEVFPPTGLTVGDSTFRSPVSFLSFEYMMWSGSF